MRLPLKRQSKTEGLGRYVSFICFQLMGVRDAVQWPTPLASAAACTFFFERK